MTDTELSTLEQTAKAATPGPWKESLYPFFIQAGDYKIANVTSKNAGDDSAFIAAANPAAILDLIAELRQARAERDWLAEHRPARYCPTVETWETCLVEVPGHKLPKACIQCWIDRAKEATCPK